MNIGDEKPAIVIEPVEDPVPAREPAPETEPDREVEPVLVPA